MPRTERAEELTLINVSIIFGIFSLLDFYFPKEEPRNLLTKVGCRGPCSSGA